MTERDPYAVLGVERSATTDEISKAYKRLARENHPDVNPGEAGAEDRFKDIAWAKEILLDAEKRKLFDEFGHQGLSPGFDPEQARTYQQWARRAGRSEDIGGFGQQADLEDLLSQLFDQTAPGGGEDFGEYVRFRQARPRRGADLQAEVEVDLLDVVRAGEVELQPAGRPKLKVRIPPGAHDGTKIRLAGQGEPAAGGAPPGDLYLKLRVRPHPFFRREGEDLHVELPVTIPELVLGAEIEVPTPEGTVKMKVPPRSKNGRRLRLKGKGAARRQGGKSDLYVEFAAVLPEAGDERLDEIVRQLEPLYERDVRADMQEGR